ncbi:MAG: HD domain-containing protein [Candidatus Nitrosotenuis sp.]
MRKLGPKLTHAQLYALKKHEGHIKKDGTNVAEHLCEVVSKLSIIGTVDEDLLCAAWLHDILEDTETSFAELEKLFGKNIALIVLSLTKNRSLEKNQQDAQYITQLKKASFGSKLIKLCDIADNLEKIDASKLPITKKVKTISRLGNYFSAIENDILNNQTKYPKVSNLVDDINRILKSYERFK